MATVHITDTTSLEANVEIDEDSPLGVAKLRSLVAAVELVGDFNNPIDQARCKGATLGAAFASPSIDAGGDRTLTIKGEVTATVEVTCPPEKSLFGDDNVTFPVPIAKGQAWMSFELQTLFDVGGKQIPVGGLSGFGVGIEASTTCTFTSYTLFDGASGPLPSVKECLSETLSNFKPLSSAASVRAQKPGTIQVCEISGTLKFTGSYSVPMSANSYSLASLGTSTLLKNSSSKLPFNYNISVNPDFDLEIAGSVAVTGEYGIRCHKVSDTTLQLGVFKKKQTDLKAAFTAAAGVQASAGKGDITAGFLNAISPKINPAAAVGLKQEDREVIRKALNSCIDHSLSASMNLSCTASFADEPAFVYTIDLSQNVANTDAALEAAFKGDWSAVQALSNAKRDRNVLVDATGVKHVATVNLLGIFEYASLEDFLSSCTMLHNQEGDGSVTVTDKETGSRIGVVGVPYLAADQRLRAVLNQACVATMTYTAAGAHAVVSAGLKVSQNFLLYKNKMDAKPVHKELLTCVALQLLSRSEWDNLLPQTASPRHVRIAAQAQFDGNAALQLFFSDTEARTPRKLPDLTILARRAYMSLLDVSDPIDVQRLQNVSDDQVWGLMDGQQWTPDLRRLSYTDWYDITFWASAFAQVGPALKATLDLVDTLPPGQDPTTNSVFMNSRAKLAKAIAQATQHSQAAFEPGWPLVVTCALSQFAAKASFDAAWDGETHVEKKAPVVAVAAG